MRLFTFFRSGTSHRLRIALNLKNINVEHIPIDLRVDAHLSDEYKTINPQGFVPVLEVDEAIKLIQSPAIIEWLEETYPDPPLLPRSLIDRAKVRSIAALIGCDVHPLNNRRVLEHLRKNQGFQDQQVNEWCQKWIASGFDALESLLDAKHDKPQFCFGQAVSLADVYLIPQVESARRFNIDMNRWPKIKNIDSHCQSIDAFAKAAPSVQPDA